MGSLKFTGKEKDQGPMEWRNDYFGARYMSAAQGRFTSPDPYIPRARPEIAIMLVALSSVSFLFSS